MVAANGGEHDEDDELDDELENLFERLLNFFFSPSHALSSILLWWCPTLVEFKLTGMMQWQIKPKTFTHI